MDGYVNEQPPVELKGEVVAKSTEEKTLTFVPDKNQNDVPTKFIIDFSTIRLDENGENASYEQIRNYLDTFNEGEEIKIIFGKGVITSKTEKYNPQSFSVIKKINGR